MKLLAIDTTEAACSAALLYDRQIIDRFTIAPRRHSELVLPMMDELLHEAGLRLSQLDALAFARGPGSFTGVRIACAVVQGAATAADLPVVPVSSLLALAQSAAGVNDAQRVLAGFDARMQEVYWAQCVSDADGLMRLDGEEQVCAPQSVPVPADGAWIGVGGAFSAYGEILQRRLGDRLVDVRAEATVQARDLVRLAARDFDAGFAVPAEQALPVYLRDQVAKKPGG
jgi:tRNA threonylcarbamoyladenosine biosynthesis protein TsaB